MDEYQILSQSTGFDWDEGNVAKNWTKHNVMQLECEQVFFNKPLFVKPDPRHSESEARFWALGVTDMARLLFVAYTVRKNKIRVISARDMSERERRIYKS